MASYKNYPTETYSTLKDLYQASAQKFGEKALIRQKESGEYVDYSFRRYGDDVDALATAFFKHHLNGKPILLIGGNCYAWTVCYMAAVCAAVVVPLDPGISADGLAGIAETCDAAAVCYSPANAEKAAALPEKIEKISFAEDVPALIDEGRNLIDGGSNLYLHAKVDPDAMCALLFTSGTTGVPKGVMLSHKNLCFTLSELASMIRVGPNDVFLSVLPLWHAYECTCGLLWHIQQGSTVAFPESLRHITRAMREIRPTMFNAVPLLLEKMYSKIWANIRAQHMEGRVRATIRVTNTVYPEKARLIAKRRAFKEILGSFGGKLRMIISGGTYADPNVLRGFREFGVLALQGYGVTECGSLVAINRDTCYEDTSAGMATPNSLLDIYDVQEDGTGELRVKGDNVMLGYYKMPELTEEVMQNGWLYTGDLATMDEKGFIRFIGRKKNVITMTDRKNVFPEELEHLLDANRFVKESVVTGFFNEKRNNYDIVAIICPDTEQMREAYGDSYSQANLDFELKKAISDVNVAVQPFKQIATYVLRNTEFPKNTSRKIIRAGIAESVAEAYQKKIGQ